MRRPLRFIHTSDVHLDSAAKNSDVEGFRNVAEYAFAQVVSAVDEEKCDLFLIVGDLFDHGRIKERDFEFVKEQLQKVSCPVVLIPGNHDVHDELSLWRRFDPHELGDHVFPIMDHGGSVVEFPDLQASIWGRAMDEHSPEFKPIEGSQTGNENTWSIGMAHGQVVDNVVNGSSSLISHTEIAETGFDYLALGHVHVWEIFHCEEVIACYSGSPVQAFASSRGGFYALVDLDPEEGVLIQKRKVDTHIKQEVVTHGVFF